MTLCPKCGQNFSKIGNHWQYNDHRPDFTEKQKEIITGLLMGDGCLNRSSTNPLLVVSCITPNYLEYLDDVFGIHSTGVTHSKTPQECVDEIVGRGFRGSADVENYNDVYRWTTRTHPELNQFNWYTENGKVWSDNIELTPTVLKHWYVGDGHFSNSGHRKRISIACSNEIDNKAKIKRMFDSAGLPTPNKYKISTRKDGSKKGDLRFTRNDSETLFEYMGEPLPDFSYKFPS